uniref:Uncharacterized protein n=1 Tax=Heliothis virescens TaxID=7102 RepID=A0A2A4IT76_HELVI
MLVERSAASSYSGSGESMAHTWGWSQRAAAADSAAWRCWWRGRPPPRTRARASPWHIPGAGLSALLQQTAQLGDAGGEVGRLLVLGLGRVHGTYLGLVSARCCSRQRSLAMLVERSAASSYSGSGESMAHTWGWSQRAAAADSAAWRCWWRGRPPPRTRARASPWHIPGAGLSALLQQTAQLGDAGGEVGRLLVLGLGRVHGTYLGLVSARCCSRQRSLAMLVERSAASSYSGSGESMAHTWGWSQRAAAADSAAWRCWWRGRPPPRTRARASPWHIPGAGLSALLQQTAQLGDAGGEVGRLLVLGLGRVHGTYLGLVSARCCSRQRSLAMLVERSAASSYSGSGESMAHTWGWSQRAAAADSAAWRCWWRGRPPPRTRARASPWHIPGAGLSALLQQTAQLGDAGGEVGRLLVLGLGRVHGTYLGLVSARCCSRQRSLAMLVERSAASSYSGSGESMAHTWGWSQRAAAADSAAWRCWWRGRPPPRTRARASPWHIPGAGLSALLQQTAQLGDAGGEVGRLLVLGLGRVHGTYLGLVSARCCSRQRSLAMLVERSAASSYSGSGESMAHTWGWSQRAAAADSAAWRCWWRGRPPPRTRARASPWHIPGAGLSALLQQTAQLGDAGGEVGRLLVLGLGRVHGTYLGLVSARCCSRQRSLAMLVERSAASSYSGSGESMAHTWGWSQRAAAADSAAWRCWWRGRPPPRTRARASPWHIPGAGLSALLQQTAQLGDAGGEVGRLLVLGLGRVHGTYLGLVSARCCSRQRSLAMLVERSAASSYSGSGESMAHTWGWSQRAAAADSAAWRCWWRGRPPPRTRARASPWHIPGAGLSALLQQTAQLGDAGGEVGRLLVLGLGRVHGTYLGLVSARCCSRQRSLAMLVERSAASSYSGSGESMAHTWGWSQRAAAADSAAWRCWWRGRPPPRTRARASPWHIPGAGLSALLQQTAQLGDAGGEVGRLLVLGLGRVHGTYLGLVSARCCSRQRSLAMLVERSAASSYSGSGESMAHTWGWSQRAAAADSAAWRCWWRGRPPPRTRARASPWHIPGAGLSALLQQTAQLGDAGGEVGRLLVLGLGRVHGTYLGLVSARCCSRQRSLAMLVERSAASSYSGSGESMAHTWGWSQRAAAADSAAWRCWWRGRPPPRTRARASPWHIPGAGLSALLQQTAQLGDAGGEVGRLLVLGLGRVHGTYLGLVSARCCSRQRSLAMLVERSAASSYSGSGESMAHTWGWSQRAAAADSAAWRCWWRGRPPPRTRARASPWHIPGAGLSALLQQTAQLGDAGGEVGRLLVLGLGRVHGTYLGLVSARCCSRQRSLAMLVERSAASSYSGSGESMAHTWGWSQRAAAADSAAWRCWWRGRPPPRTRARASPWHIPGAGLSALLQQTAQLGDAGGEVGRLLVLGLGRVHGTYLGLVSARCCSRQRSLAMLVERSAASSYSGSGESMAHTWGWSQRAAAADSAAWRCWWRGRPPPRTRARASPWHIPGAGLSALLQQTAQLGDAGGEVGRLLVLGLGRVHGTYLGLVSARCCSRQRSLAMLVERSAASSYSGSGESMAHTWGWSQRAAAADSAAWRCWWRGRPPPRTRARASPWHIPGAGLSALLQQTAQLGDAGGEVGRLLVLGLGRVHGTYLGLVSARCCSRQRSLAMLVERSAASSYSGSGESMAHTWGWSQRAAAADSAAWRCWWRGRPPPRTRARASPWHIPGAGLSALLQQTAQLGDAGGEVGRLLVLGLGRVHGTYLGLVSARCCSRQRSLAMLVERSAASSYSGSGESMAHTWGWSQRAAAADSAAWRCWWRGRPPPRTRARASPWHIPGAGLSALLQQTAQLGDAGGEVGRLLVLGLGRVHGTYLGLVSARCCSRQRSLAMLVERSAASSYSGSGESASGAGTPSARGTARGNDG